MGEMRDMANRIQDILRLRTFPVAVKFLETVDDLGKIEKVRRPDEPLSFCQIVAISRYLGWTMGVTIDDLSMAGCILKLGFAPAFGPFLDGTSTRPWMKTQEDAAKYAATLPHLPVGKFKAVALAPLASERFEPDIVWIFANTAQMCYVLNALQWENYERFTFYFSGEGSCADAFVECYYSGKPQVTVPCEGERIQALVMEDELEVAIPGSMVKKLLDGLEGLRAARIISYPMPYYGFQTSTSKLMSRAYPMLDAALKILKAKAPK